jgi:Fe-S-cluster containining protein
MKNIKTECDRCGTCCRKGGPALHIEDMRLLLNGWLKPEHLVTIRKREPVFLLAGENPEPTRAEIVKIKGKGSEWTCLFFDTIEAGCTIYQHRPLECSLLKCWNTADLENVTGKNLLSRYDMIEPGNPVLPFIKIHEEKCSLENFASQLSGPHNKNLTQKVMTNLTDLVNTDLAIRTQACETFHLSLELELFFFGRPVFKILQQIGITMHIVNGVCRLSC